MTTSKIVARLINAIAHDVLKGEKNLSNSEIMAILEKIEASFLQEAEGSVDLAIEIKRITLGHKFKIISLREASFEEVDAMYQEVLSQGFSNLMEEGTVGIYYAQYCMRTHHSDAAKAVLENMLLKAGDISSGPPRVRKQLERDAKRVLDSLRSA